MSHNVPRGEEGDYRYAGELRWERIEIPRARMEENNQFLNDWPRGYGTTNSEASKELIASELELLEHTVGLLDGELMKLRKCFVRDLKGGRYRTAFMLARVIEALEKEYFPTAKPVVVELSYSKSADEKSNYGAENIIQTLYTLTINNAPRKEYKKSFGNVQLLDVMGFSQDLNK